MRAASEKDPNNAEILHKLGETLIRLEKDEVLDEAKQIKNTDIAEELALPPVKIHCSVLAEDAIRSAIDDYHSKQVAEHSVVA